MFRVVPGGGVTRTVTSVSGELVSEESSELDGKIEVGSEQPLIRQVSTMRMKVIQVVRLMSTIVCSQAVVRIDPGSVYVQRRYGSLSVSPPDLSSELSGRPQAELMQLYPMDSVAVDR